MTPRARALLATSLVLAVAALAAAPAQAAFHLMKIREVYPGSAVNPAAEFVELQMHAAGQNLVTGQSVRLYGAAGNVTASATFAGPVPNAGNQRSILVATADAQAEFGVAPDLLLPTAGMAPAGAACFSSIDCVSWGSFSGFMGMPPSPTGTPEGPIPDGSSIERTIAPGCSTLLEGSDDTNDSAKDFSPAAPSPRNNATAPTETPCAGGSDTTPPETEITKGPGRQTTDRTPTFKFASSEARSTFECKVDGKPFRRCSSPETLRRLSFGEHKFKVRATDPAGNTDPTPAKQGFRVKRER